jgi:hypothetical protein
LPAGGTGRDAAGGGMAGSAGMFSTTTAGVREMSLDDTEDCSCGAP